MNGEHFSGEYPVLDLRKSHTVGYREILCDRTRSRIRSWYELDKDAVIGVIEHVEMWTEPKDQRGEWYARNKRD